jgi:hypothetical protein
MLSRLPIVTSLAALAVFSVNCSSGDGTPATTKTVAPAESIVDTGTAPCNLHTSFGDVDGDAQCILPPDAAHGMQFHYGPTNYNDPVEVSKYTLQPGGEQTLCSFFMTTNTDTVYFDAYHSRMRAGSHHMLLYIQSAGGPSLDANGGISLSGGTAPPIVETGSNGPTDCNQGLSTRNLFGAQTATLDVDQLTAGAAENNGLAVEIPPVQQGVLQAHFINATSKPILMEVWANVMYVDKSLVTQLGDPIFFLGGLGMNVPMGQSQAITGHATVPSGVAPDFRLVIGTGHYHAHTTEFTAWATVNGQKQQIIQEYGILGVAPEPKTWYFDSALQNPTPDLSTQTSGAASGILHMQTGDTISWECDVTNNNVQGGIQFANAVYTGEMCNMFGMYVPSFGTPWSATNF